MARRKWTELGLSVASLFAMATCARFVTTRPTPVTAAPTLTQVAVPASDKPAVGAPPEPLAREADPRESVAVGSCGAPAQAFARALDTYRNGKLEGSIRILWFGDSHSAADHWPSAVRKALSAVIPISGPGYVAFGAPSYRHGMMRVWQDGAVEMAPHPAARRSVEDDGVFGLGGTRLTLKDSSATVVLKPSFEGAAGQRLDYQLWYRTTSDSDGLVLTAGSERMQIGPGSGETQVRGLSRFRFAASGDSRIELRSMRGKPQLFGVVVEAKHSGLVIDTLGINGARFGTFLAWEPEAFAAVVADRNPALAIIAYGTNEVFDDESIVRHVARLEQVVGRLRSASPDTDCLVVGPPDLTKGGEAAAARVQAIDQAERSTAERLGCGYFSPYDVMAAEGGYAAWSRLQPPLALSDGVHLTVRGYTRLGEALAAHCLLSGLRS